MGIVELLEGYLPRIHPLTVMAWIVVFVPGKIHVRIGDGLAQTILKKEIAYHRLGFT